MPKFNVMTDITNTNKVLSKDHGVLIKKGEVLEYDKVPDRIKQLQKLGVVKEAQEDQNTADENPDNVNDQDPAGDQDPAADDQDPAAPADEKDPADMLPDDLEELKAIAEGMEIDFAKNIGAKKLKERIIQASQEKE